MKLVLMKKIVNLKRKINPKLRIVTKNLTENLKRRIVKRMKKIPIENLRRIKILMTKILTENLRKRINPRMAKIPIENPKAQRNLKVEYLNPLIKNLPLKKKNLHWKKE